MAKVITISNDQTTEKQENQTAFVDADAEIAAARDEAMNIAFLLYDSPWENDDDTYSPDESHYEMLLRTALEGIIHKKFKPGQVKKVGDSYSLDITDEEIAKWKEQMKMAENLLSAPSSDEVLAWNIMDVLESKTWEEVVGVKQEMPEWMFPLLVLEYQEGASEQVEEAVLDKGFRLALEKELNISLKPGQVVTDFEAEDDMSLHLYLTKEEFEQVKKNIADGKKG